MEQILWKEEGSHELTERILPEIWVSRRKVHKTSQGEVFEPRWNLQFSAHIHNKGFLWILTCRYKLTAELEQIRILISFILAEDT